MVVVRDKGVPPQQDARALLVKVEDVDDHRPRFQVRDDGGEEVVLVEDGEGKDLCPHESPLVGHDELVNQRGACLSPCAASSSSRVRECSVSPLLRSCLRVP